MYDSAWIEATHDTAGKVLREGRSRFDTRVRIVLLKLFEAEAAEADEYDSAWIKAVHDAAGKVLREALPMEITLQIFRHHLDPIVPDHLLLAEDRPLDSKPHWVRGLN
jgi:hypothetical protein